MSEVPLNLRSASPSCILLPLRKLSSARSLSAGDRPLLESKLFHYLYLQAKSDDQHSLSTEYRGAFPWRCHTRCPPGGMYVDCILMGIITVWCRLSSYLMQCSAFRERRPNLCMVFQDPSWRWVNRRQGSLRMGAHDSPREPTSSGRYNVLTLVL